MHANAASPAFTRLCYCTRGGVPFTTTSLIFVLQSKRRFRIVRKAIPYNIRSLVSDRRGPQRKREAMNARSIFSWLMLFPLSCAISVPAPAQTAKHTAAARQHAADEASRNQLADELAEFQGNPEDAALRSRIIRVGQELGSGSRDPPACAG